MVYDPNQNDVYQTDLTKQPNGTPALDQNGQPIAQGRPNTAGNPAPPIPYQDPNATATQTTSQTTGQTGQTQAGGATSFANQGGGWEQAAGNPAASALQNAFSQGLSGQAAVDAANAAAGLQPPNSISFGNGGYGVPGGFYVAPNAAKGSQLDLIKRAAGDTGVGGGGGRYVPGQGMIGQGSIFNAQGGNPRSNALEDLLMKRAGQNIVPSATDPVIKAQVDAYNAQQQQASRQGQTQAAERVGGSNTVNMGAEARSAAEQVGQNTGAFQGQVMQRELDARRQEVQSALSGAQGMLTAEEQMQLQEELAQLSNAQQAYQFDTSRQDHLAGF